MKEHQKKQERRHDEMARERRRHLLILRAQHMVQRMSDAMSAPRPTLHVDD